MITREEILAEYPDLTPVAIHHALRRLADDDEIQRVAQGRYTLVDPRVAGPSAHRFSILTGLYRDSAIAGWSALSHWGLTEQIPRIIDLAVLRGTHVRGRSQAMRVVRVFHVPSREWFGIQRVWLSDGEQVPMFSRERSIYDTFLAPSRYGGTGPAMEVLTTAFEETDATLNALVETAAQSSWLPGIRRFIEGLRDVRGEDVDVSPLERRLEELSPAAVR